MQEQIIKSIYANIGRPAQAAPVKAALSSYVDDVLRRQLNQLKGQING